jgi:hypothetical protein
MSIFTSKNGDDSDGLCWHNHSLSQQELRDILEHPTIQIKPTSKGTSQVSWCPKTHDEGPEHDQVLLCWTLSIEGNLLSYLWL